MRVARGSNSPTSLPVDSTGAGATGRSHRKIRLRAYSPALHANRTCSFHSHVETPSPISNGDQPIKLLVGMRT